MLSLEVTRRCNLNCAHCMRGEAQNIDMSNDIIDNLLVQTNEIEKVLFTGGEPLLALDKIKYFLKEVKGKEIPLYGLQIITNGTCFTNEVIEIIKEYSNYIEKCYEIKYKKTFSKEFKERHTVIGISCDKYHDVDAIEIYKKYKEKFTSYAFLILHTSGELTKAIGKGERLEQAVETHEYCPHRIEIFGNDRTCHCKAVTKYMKEHQPNDNIIMCPIEISATGELKGIEEDYNDNKNSIGNLTSQISILDDIEKYNYGKLPCVLAEKIDISRIIKMYKDSDHAYRWFSICMSKNDLDKKIKNEIKDYNDDFTKPSEIFYEYYGDSLDKIKKEFEKYIGDKRSEIDIIADYKYKEYSDIYKQYPTLTYNECKELYGCLSDRIHYKNEIKKYKVIHYKRLFYIEMMKETSNVLFIIKLFKYYSKIKNIDEDRLYEIYCASMPKSLVESIKKNLFFEIIHMTETDLEINRASYIFMVLSKRIKWIIKTIDLTGDKEEPSKEIEDVIYRKLAILYCYKELVPYYQHELDFNKRNSIKEIDTNINELIYMYENIIDSPLLIMILQNSNDNINGRKPTYNEEAIRYEKFKMIYNPIECIKFMQIKKLFDKYNIYNKMLIL